MILENRESVGVAYQRTSMNYLASLLLPAALGLIAGATHGLVSHAMDLPVALEDQMVFPFESVQPLD